MFQPKIFGCILFLLFLVIGVDAQPSLFNDLRLKDDSLRVVSERMSQGEVFKTTKTKSPTIAMLLSAGLPGAGQLYNESYWKIPVILGLAGYWGYEWVGLNREYKNFKNLYSESLIKLPPSGNYQYRTDRDFYRSERDKFAWYLGILYVVNILDAYVDASLFEFSVDDNLANHYSGFKLRIFF
ncbi:MAG: DUF5683 domain-containing protein [Bacteroidota bacterium]|nr:DUF5683 domain-containing protein [Bacteroidota bacterium]